MFNLRFAVLIVLGSCLGQSYGLSYCDKELCGGNTHVACNNNGSFSSECDPTAQVVSFSPEQIQVVLDFHNDLRNRVAGGQLGLPTAAHMLTMEWSPLLAEFALLNVKQCKMYLDECRNTPKWPYVGQSVSKVSFTKPIDPFSFMKQQFNSWSDQSKQISPELIAKYKSGSPVGQFTQMVRGDSPEIGCAMVKHRSAIFLTCNYALANMLDDPVYEIGPSTSKCKSGKNDKYTNLCSSKETSTPDIQSKTLMDKNDYSDEEFMPKFSGHDDFVDFR